MTDHELLVLVAGALVNVTECPPNTNKGLKVEEMLALCSLAPGNPWCAAYVAYVGRTAWGARWPLKLVGGCVSLWEDGKAKAMDSPSPVAGGIFLVYHPEVKRLAHTGFIVRANADGSFVTREGNTSGGGSREGWGVFERTRTFKPEDRFLFPVPL